MLSWQRGQSKRRHPSVFPPPSHPLLIIYEQDWWSLTELSAASVYHACCLSLYTPIGGGLWHSHTQTRAPFYPPPPCPHSPRHALRFCLHHPCSRNRSRMHTRWSVLLCLSQYGVCAAWHTRTLTSCATELTSSRTDAHFHKHWRHKTGENLQKGFFLKDWII